jgi:CheY-like chemotaxis protein
LTVASLPFSGGERINLTSAEVLLADSAPESMEILVQMFSGFGVHTPRRAANADEAMAVVRDRELELVVVDGALAGKDGYEFTRWLRRDGGKPNAFCPVILITGHTKPTQIYKGRDAGANFVIRKPVPPLIMMQRILWVSKEARPFVDSPNYCGPDRRFRALGPPVGAKGRRHDDLSAEVGEATMPNLDQSDIDALFQPKKAV